MWFGQVRVGQPKVWFVLHAGYYINIRLHLSMVGGTGACFIWLNQAPKVLTDWTTWTTSFRWFPRGGLWWRESGLEAVPGWRWMGRRQEQLQHQRTTWKQRRVTYCWLMSWSLCSIHLDFKHICNTTKALNFTFNGVTDWSSPRKVG